MQLKTTKPLLMIIDLQNAIDDPSWGIRNNLNAEDNILQLLSKWRELNLPVLHIKHMSTEPYSKYRPNQSGNDFKEVCKPHTGEEIFEKTSNSPFIHTDLDSALRSRGIKDIIIVGVVTNNSVEATARNAGNLGYNTVVVSNATFTFNQTDFSGKEHSADDIHNISLANMDGEYASIIDTASVIQYVSSLL